MRLTGLFFLVLSFSSSVIVLSNHNHHIYYFVAIGGSVLQSPEKSIHNIYVQ